MMGPTGGLLIGDKGKIMNQQMRWRLIPEKRALDYGMPPQKLERSPGHFVEWIQACKGGSEKPGSNFDWAGPLTEVVLLGNVALRMKPDLATAANNRRIALAMTREYDAALAGVSEREYPSTRVSLNAFMTRATSLPIRPKPKIPTVFPASVLPAMAGQDSSRMRALIWGIFRSSARIKARHGSGCFAARR